MHTLGVARGVEILRSQPKGEGIRMNTNITKAQTTTEATEISAKAQAITEKYHISGTIEAAETKLAAAVAALEAAQRELDLAKRNNEFEKLLDWLSVVKAEKFVHAVRYAVNNANNFPEWVPFDCPNADDAYCGVIVEAAKKAGKEIQGDLLLTLIRKEKVSGYEVELCIKAWEDIVNS